MSRKIPHSEQPSVDGPASQPESSADLIGYVVAALILIIGGAIVRTPILNWICGPALVISCVVLVGTLRDRRR